MNAANNSLHTSEAGLSLIKQCEGCRLDSYRDQNGVCTIGIGHTGKLVHIGMSCTEAEAMCWLAQDVEWAERAVKTYVNVPLAQHQFDALVDFVFNEGSGSFFKSSLRALINVQVTDAKQITAAFGNWVYIGAVESKGLIARRAAEAAMFTGDGI